LKRVTTVEDARAAIRGPRLTDGNAAFTAGPVGDDTGTGYRFCTAGIARGDSIRRTLSAQMLARRRTSTISMTEAMTCTNTIEAGGAVPGTGVARREETLAGSSAGRAAAGLAVHLSKATYAG